MLTTLFLDLNSYFASAEQQLQPALRGRPVGVVPLMAETTCCIAASYEAKAHGVKTGTRVSEARRLCPAITFVEARPETYVHLHHQVIRAVERCLPVAAIHSIDELHCTLLGREREPDRAVELAQQIKASIAECVGEQLRSSIAIAPNRFLAKVGTELEKPDGLVVIERKDLPGKLHGLSLRDLPGIGPRMHQRLLARGVDSVERLCALSEGEMLAIWQSVIGRVWFRWLRGEDVWEPPTHRRSIGHQHVLPPERRTQEGARGVLVRLLSKAAMRLRSLGYWAQQMTVGVKCLDDRSFSRTAKLPLTQDTMELLEAFGSIWPMSAARLLPGTPLRVSITLHELEANASVAPPLFPGARKRLQLAQTMDAINTKFGRAAVYPGSMHDSRKTAPTRIAFKNIPDLTLPA
ncbi:MAG: DNA polymerase [Phycisphaerales bacterium]|nr:MAG: DNA polymerase [Phycisphaerales bacterium]